MSNMVAIAYDDLPRAQQVMGTLSELVDARSLALADAVIVERQRDDKVRLHQPSAAGAGAALGAFWGGLIGLVFLMPLFGAPTGVGVDDRFVKSLGSKVEPGSAAVIALVQDAAPGNVLPAIGDHGGYLLQTCLSIEQEAALEAALSKAITPRG